MCCGVKGGVAASQSSMDFLIAVCTDVECVKGQSGS